VRTDYAAFIVNAIKPTMSGKQLAEPAGPTAYSHPADAASRRTYTDITARAAYEASATQPDTHVAPKGCLTADAGRPGSEPALADVATGRMSADEFERRARGRGSGR
jgi:hypothetical protein